MDNGEPKKDWKVLERHYKLLSEVWQFEYHDSTKISLAIMIMHGVLVEMHSEVIQFEIKHGGSEKTTKSYNRLLVLEKQLDEISRVQDDFFAMRFAFKKIAKENYELKVKLGIEQKIQKEANELNNLPDSIKL